MSADRDYVVSVGLQLADDSVAEVSRQIEAALSKVPALQLKIEGVAALERLANTLQKVTSNSGEVSSAISRTTSALQAQNQALREAQQFDTRNQQTQAAYARDRFNEQVRLNNELDRSLDLFSRMNEMEQSSSLRNGIRQGRANAPDNNDLFNGQSVDDLIARNHAANATMGATINSVMAGIQDEISRAAAVEDATINQSIRRAYPAGGGGPNAGGSSVNEEAVANAAQYVVGQKALNQEIENGQAILDRYMGTLQSSVAAHQRAAAALPPEIANYKGLGDELAHQLITFAQWAAMAKLVEGVAGTMSKGMQNAMQAQREQVLQGFYYQAQGKNFDSTMSQNTMNQAIAMARVYGDEVMHVQEAIGLWAKDTQGELNPALAMTSEAMKLNAVSGMDMEQIYRETTAILSQTNKPLSEQSHLYDVAVAAATRYGGAMQSLEGQSDDMVKQMLEGIAEASVEFGKVGMSFEQMGAMIAVVVQNFGEKMSGNQAGQRLADALAGITESKQAVEALNAAHIELHNNSHFMDDVAAHWDTLGSSIEGAVRKVDRPVWDAVIKQIKEVDSAAQHLGDTASQGILDKLLEKTMGTAQFQLLQVKSGFEALGIQIGTDLLPAMQSFIAFLSNAITFASALHKELASLAVGVGWSIALVGGLQLVTSAIAGFFRAWETLKASLASMGVFMSASAQQLAVLETPLSNYQRQLLSLATTDGVVSAEMEANIRAVAATRNLSIDAMIAEILKLQGVEVTATGAIILSEEQLETASAALALKFGIDQADMRAAMIASAAQADISAAGIAGAFAKAIPVIGTAVTIAMMAWTTIDAIKSAKDAQEVSHMRHDSNYRHQVAAEANANNNMDAVRLKYGLYDNDTQGGGRVYFKPGGVNYGVDHQSLLDDQRSNYHQLELVQAANVADPNQSIKDLQAQLKIDESNLKSQMSKMYANPNGANPSTDNPVGAASTKGIASDAQKAATATDDLKLKYDKLITTEETLGAKDKQHIQDLLSQISHHGIAANSVGDLTAAYDKYGLNLQHQISLETQVQKAYQNRQAALQAKAQAVGLDTTQGQSFERQADAMGQAADALSKKIQDLRDRLQSLQDQRDAKLFSLDKVISDQTLLPLIQAADAAKQQLTADGKYQTVADLDAAQQANQKLLDTYDQQIAVFQQLGTAGESYVQSLQKQREAVANTIEQEKSREDTLKQSDETLRESLKDNLQQQWVEASAPFDTHIQEYGKAVLALIKQYNSDMITLADAGDQTGMAMEQMWARNQEGVLQNKLALQEYTDQINALKQSAMFQGIAGGIDAAGSSLATGLVNNLDGTTQTNQQILGLQNQVTQLENERNLLVGQYYDVQREQLKNEENELNDKIKQLQHTIQDPSLGKKVMDAVTKGLVDGLMKSFEDQLKQAFIDQFIPKLKQTNDTQQKIIDEFKQTVDGQLKQSFDQWGSSVNQLIPALNRNSQAYENFAQKAVTVGDNTAAGQQAYWNSFMDGTTPVNLDLSHIDSSSFSSSGSKASDAAASTGTFNASPNANGVLGYMGGAAAVFAVANNAFNNPSSAGSQPAAKGGFSISGLMGSLGDFGMAAAGMSTGGIAGGLETGLGMDQGLMSLSKLFTGGAAAGGGIGGILGTASPYIGAAMALFSLFSHHDNPALMPDVYDTQAYGTSLADLMGSGQPGGAPMEANGQSFTEDPALAQELGNKGELAYIATFLKDNPSMASKVLTPQELQMFQGLSTTGGNIINGKNGNEELANGQWVQWQSLANAAQSAVSAIQQFTNAANQATQPLIAIQGFGAGAGVGFSPYYTPGFGQHNYSDYMKNTPYYAANSSYSNSSSGPASTTNPIGNSGGPSGPPGTITITSNLMVGARQIAQAVQNVRIQQNSAGWAQV